MPRKSGVFDEAERYVDDLEREISDLNDNLIKI